MATEPEYDPAMLVAVVGITTALVIITVRWLHELARQAPPDPWPPEFDLAVRARDAVPVCVDCLSPQAGHRWFCPHCGFPAGEYVTTLPYLQIFAIGELLRRGVTGPPAPGLRRTGGFVLASLAQYSLFAPVYWFWLILKECGKPICSCHRLDLRFEDAPPPPDANAPGT